MEMIFADGRDPSRLHMPLQPGESKLEPVDPGHFSDQIG